MKQVLCSVSLLSLCFSQVGSLPALAIAPAIQSSSFCQQEYYQQAFTQWAELSEWLVSKAETSTEPSSTTLTEMEQELERAGQSQHLTQLAIDRLTIRGGGYDDLQRQPLLNLLDRLPQGQQPQILPITERLLMLSGFLTNDFPLAKTRSQIVSAQVYQQLGRRDRALELLFQATQFLSDVQGAQLIAEAELRLAEAWFTLAQAEQGLAALDRAAAQTVVMYRTQSGNNPVLAERIVSNYLQQRELVKAREFAQKLPPAWDGSIQLFRVAIAYHQTQQPSVARQLFNQAVQNLVEARRLENPSDLPLALGAIQFAQLGELSLAILAAQQLSAEVPHLRARVWLAIAGEARQQNQPQVAVQAMNQLVAAGRLGAKSHFGLGFGDQRDYEWSQALYALSRNYGYEPEMVQFLQRMNLQLEGTEFLIEQALQAKQFEQAQQLVPIPMSRAIEAGVFEVHDYWLERIATEAAQAGQFTQALQLAEANPMNLGMLVRLADALKQGGNSAEADRLVAEVVERAAQLDGQPRHTYELASAIQALQQQGSTQAASQMLPVLQTRLQAVEDPAEQREQLLKVHTWGRLNFETWVQLVQRLGLENQPEVRQFLINQSFVHNRLDLVEQFALTTAPAANQVEWLVRLGERSLKQQNQSQAIALFDRALAIAPDTQVVSAPYPTWWNALPNGYLKLNQQDKALQAARAISNPEQQAYQLQRLACY